MFSKTKILLPVLFLIAGLLIAATGCVRRTVIMLPTGSSDQVWPQFQNDCRNSGVTTSAEPVSRPAVGWKRQVGSNAMTGISVVPLVAGGNVYVLDALGEAWAFDARTGAQKWVTPLSATGMIFQLSTPAYDNSRLYAATNDGHVYALEAASGKILWDRSLPLASSSSQLNTPVKCAGGKIYLGAWSPDPRSDEYYYCLDAVTGRPAIGGNYRVPNSAAPGGYYWAGACIVGRCLIFGADSSVVTCLDKDTGALLDSVDLKQIVPGAREIRSSLSYDPAAKMLFLTDQARDDGSCWAFGLDPATGRLTSKWHTQLGFSTSTPAVYGGRLYVGAGIYSIRGGVHCLDEATGKEIWKFIAPGAGATSVPGVQASPVISVQDGRPYIYISTIWEQSSVICLDQNGKQVWEFRDQNSTYTLQGVAAADGWLYFGNDSGWIYALKPPPAA